MKKILGLLFCLSLCLMSTNVYASNLWEKGTGENASTPTGSTYYARIGHPYNNSSDDFDVADGNVPTGEQWRVKIGDNGSNTGSWQIDKLV